MSLWWIAVLLLAGLTISTVVGLIDAAHEMRERTKPRRRDQTLEEAVDTYRRRR